ENGASHTSSFLTGLVKAVNTAVDLIVAHFGTSRDPGVKAKLGNSSVSPNVGHLVLKYLCPAVQAVLEDGLKAFVLDVIIGQRKNTPWSVVEASTQLGRGRTATLGSRLNLEFQRLENAISNPVSSQAHPPRSCMVSTTRSASSRNSPATLCASTPSSWGCSSKCRASESKQPASL
ncbi:AP-4 complex accessory subunit RUSC2, partial [Lemmus lemmus]